MKINKFRLHWHGVMLFFLFCIAVVFRIFLAYQNWPLPNSDEGTMGVIGMHIQQGARPVIYYDQDYMGVLQAYLGSFFFTLFGSSVFTLRLGMVTLYAGFLLSMYFLIAQLYTRRFAIFIVALFSFGSAAMLSRQLLAIGGYPETVFFATLSLAIGLRLALTGPTGSWQNQLSRYGLFFLWGIAIALGIWNDTLILPWVACSSLFLLFSLGEIFRKGAIFVLLAGFLLGAIPLIAYNMHALAHHDTISVLLGQMGHVPLNAHTLITQISNTFSISLPTISGSPTCYKSEYPFLFYWGFGTYWHSYCSVTNVIWSIGFVLFTVLAAALACRSLLKMHFPVHRRRTFSPEEHRLVVLNCGRLILILGILGTVLPYLRSSTVLYGPGANARYLIGVWIGLPALIWPLWSGASSLQVSASRSGLVFRKMGPAFCLSLLACFLCISIYGSYLTVLQIPSAQVAAQQEQQLIQDLKSHGITHLYADYWICYRLNFDSRSSITCAIAYERQLKKRLTLSNNKYAPYLKLVQRDTYSPYMLDKSDKVMYLAITKKIKSRHLTYRVSKLNDVYIIIQPTHV